MAELYGTVLSFSTEYNLQLNYRLSGGSDVKIALFHYFLFHYGETATIERRFTTVQSSSTFVVCRATRSEFSEFSKKNTSGGEKVLLWI